MNIDPSRVNLIIFGAGGHGRVVADSAVRAGIANITFVDDQPKAVRMQGWPVVAAHNISANAWRENNYIVAIGANGIRADVYLRLKELGGTLVCVIDPRSVVSQHAAIGPGSFIAAGAIVNTGTKIGANCIVNTAASIDHDCILGDHSQVSPHTCLTGNVRLGEGVMVGAGAIILPGCTIGQRTVVGAGAVVTRNLPAHIVAWGMPARAVEGKDMSR